MNPELYKSHAKELASQHWSYVSNVVSLHQSPDTDNREITIAEFHYKTATEHGFKHGVEWLIEMIKANGVEWLQSQMNEKIS